MFEFGSGEILVLLLLALLLLGPKRLPEVARQLGRMVNQFKRATGELQDYLQQAAEEEPPRPASPAPPALPKPPAPLSRSEAAPEKGAPGPGETLQ